MPRETEFLLAVLALATVAPPPTGANAQRLIDFHLESFAAGEFRDATSLREVEHLAAAESEAHRRGGLNPKNS